MGSKGHELLALAVLFWATLVGIVVVFLRITSTRAATRRARREQRLCYRR